MVQIHFFCFSTCFFQMGGGIFANLILIRLPMKKILKLSLVLAGISVLQIILGIVNYFDPLPLFGTYGIVGQILCLIFFSMLLHKTSRRSRLKWPLGCFVANCIVCIFCTLCVVYFYTHPVVDPESYEAVLACIDWYDGAYILSLILGFVSYIWFGTFFRRRSAVRISAFLIPVVVLADFVWSRMITANASSSDELRGLIMVIGINLLDTIFYYSFYKYNKTYGRG